VGLNFPPSISAFGGTGMEGRNPQMIQEILLILSKPNVFICTPKGSPLHTKPGIKSVRNIGNWSKSRNCGHGMLVAKRILSLNKHLPVFLPFLQLFPKRSMSRIDCISNRNIKVIATYLINRLGHCDNLFQGIPFPAERYKSP
jgi:hypothetical protein